MRAAILIGLLAQACGGNSQGSGALAGAGGSFGWSSTSTGGTCAVGGTASSSASAGVGCTGNLEAYQSCSGLCVANMATISGPAGSPDYRIDVTEVTQGQYQSWLATNPALPPKTDAVCGTISSYAPQNSQITGADADHLPVVYVTWCDAYAYCLGAGKRLCGAINGGSNSYDNGADANTSQWYRACSSGGMNAYPYGSVFQWSSCAGLDSDVGLVVVGSLRSCVASTTGYAGVFDLSGNVSEWENSCLGPPPVYCRLRGGSFVMPSNFMACDTGSNGLSSASDYFIGFRCCSI